MLIPPLAMWFKIAIEPKFSFFICKINTTLVQLLSMLFIAV